MMSDLALNFFNPAIIGKVWPFLLQGFYMTLLLSAIVVPLGLVGGLLVAMLHSLGLRWLNWLLMAYVDLFRALPPLVLLIFIYFGAPFLELDLPKLLAVAIAFLLNTLEVIKLTTLASVVALPELLNNARQAQSLTYNATPIVLAALIYLALLWPIVRLLSRLEHKSLAQRH